MAKDNVRGIFEHTDPVGMIEELLHVAKTNHVTGISVVFTTADGDVGIAHNGERYLEMIGALEVLKRQMLEEKVGTDGG